MKIGGSMISCILSFVMLGLIRAVACHNVDVIPLLDVCYEAESGFDFEIMTASHHITVKYHPGGCLISVMPFEEFRILKADEQYKVLKVGTAVVGCLLLIVAVCSAMYRWSRTPKAGDKADKCRCRPDTRDDSEDDFSMQTCTEYGEHPEGERSKLPPSVLPMLRAAEVSREVNTKFV